MKSGQVDDVFRLNPQIEMLQDRIFRYICLYLCVFLWSFFMILFIFFSYICLRTLGSDFLTLLCWGWCEIVYCLMNFIIRHILLGKEIEFL